MFRFTQNTMVCAPSSSTRTCSFWLWYAHARRCCCYCRWSRARARPQALTRAMLAALLQLVLACGLSAMIGAQLALAKYVPLAPPGMGAQGVPGGQGGQGGKLGWGKWGHQGKLGKLGGLGGLERRGGQGRQGGGTGRQLRMRATVERGKRGKTVRPNDNIRISPSILSPSAGAVCIRIRIHDTYTYHVLLVHVYVEETK